VLREDIHQIQAKFRVKLRHLCQKIVYEVTFVLDVQFGCAYYLACVFNVIFSFENSRKNGRAEGKSFLKLLLERLRNG
jgi:hypothetical protein